MYHSSAEGGKQLTGQIGRVLSIPPVFSSHVIIEQPTVGRAMNMRMRHIHPIAFDGAGHPADEDDRTILLDLLHDADMGQGIVDQPISVEVPGIIEEHQVSGLYHWPAMESTVFPNVVVNEPHAVGPPVCRALCVEIDTVGEINGACHAGAVVTDATALTFDRRGADQVDGCANDRLLAAVAMTGTATVGNGSHCLSQAL